MNDELRPSEGQNESQRSDRGFGDQGSDADGPNSIQKLLKGQYLDIARKLILTPYVFFSEIGERSFEEAAFFLAMSLGINSAIHAVTHSFNIVGIPWNFCAQAVVVLIVSAAAFLLGKGFGSHCGFIRVFQIFAYCSCLNTVAEIPLLGFIGTIYGLCLNYIGLQSLMRLDRFKTAIILSFLLFGQTVLTFALMMGH